MLIFVLLILVKLHDHLLFHNSYNLLDAFLLLLWKVLSVTYVKGGVAYDFTPSFVEFGGTLRSLTTEGLHKLQRRVEEVCYHEISNFVF